jgi:hypothetical protein
MDGQRDADGTMIGAASMDAAVCRTRSLMTMAIRFDISSIMLTASTVADKETIKSDVVES